MEWTSETSMKFGRNSTTEKSVSFSRENSHEMSVSRPHRRERATRRQFLVARSDVGIRGSCIRQQHPSRTYPRMYVWMTGGTMPRRSATVAVLFVLLVSHGGALPVDDIFSLV